MLWKTLISLFIAISANSLIGEVLVYNWRVSGSELYSATGNTLEEVNQKVRQRGYMVVNYNTETGVYSNSKLVRYWKDKNTKIKYYCQEDFILGIASFNQLTTEKGKYQTMSGFYGGVNGEYYSGKMKTTRLKGGGDKQQVSKRLNGTSNWDKTFDSGATTNGSGKVRLSLNSRITRQVNDDVNPLDVDGAIEFILNEKLNGYTETDAENITLNGETFEEIVITSGVIDGVVIGGTNPGAGTFTSLTVGKDGTSGQITLYSEQGDQDQSVVLKPSGTMTQDTVYYFPNNDGDADQVLTTDGNGVLSWQSTTVTGTVTWANVIKTGSSLADLETRSAGDLNSGNLDMARMPTGGDWAITSNLDIDSNTLVVDQTNNRIGIGTASPSAALSVVGKTTCSSGNFAAAGDAQFVKVLMRNQTTDATQTELFVNGADERLTLPENTAWTFSIFIAAKQASANTGGGYKVEGAIMRDDSGNTSIIGTGGVTTWGGVTFGGVTVNADDDNDSLRILVTGADSTTIRWVATVQLTQVTSN